LRIDTHFAFWGNGESGQVGGKWREGGRNPRGAILAVAWGWDNGWVYVDAELAEVARALLPVRF